MRSRYSRRTQFENVDVNTVLAEIDTQTNDRALAVIAGGFVEDLLGMAIQARIELAAKRSMTPDGVEEVFEKMGPLSTGYFKIVMATALNIINDELRDDLERIKNIRNYAAHETSSISFDDQDLRDECSNLKCWALTKDTEKSKATNAREKFRLTVKMILGLLAICIAADMLKLKSMQAKPSPQIPLPDKSE